MAQNGRAINGQNNANGRGLLKPSLFRFYSWNDRGHDTQHVHVADQIQRRKLDIQKLDNAPFQKLVTFVAASGFFIDGYLLFANNFALPILGYLYWPDASSSDHETGINCATLAGTITGQIVLGISADRKGRQKVYGYELLIVLLGSVAISMASAGQVLPGSSPGNGSMSITAWLVVLRFVIGFGVGAEYPITAAITSEWAPARHRGQMLAWVFSAQSLGQCVAAIVAYSALAGGRLPLDAVWRLIYGVAAIPAFFVFFVRRTIPETPRFVYDVQRNTAEASDIVRYMTATDKEVDAENLEAGDPDDPDDPLTKMPPEPSYKDFKEYFFGPKDGWYNCNGDEIWSLGNWTTFRFTGNRPRLLGTAGTWFLLDLSFFGLGLNSPQIVTGLWKGCRNDNVSNPLPIVTWNSEPNMANSAIPLFKDNEYGFWLIVSLGAIAGSGLLILIARFVDRKKLLWTTFLALSVLFFMTGGILWHKVMNHYSAPYFAVIAFYALCQFPFNLGPNALTFMLPAELFPTRYRCTCHGISAAFGKLGSIIAQVSLLNIQFNALDNCQLRADTNLGKVLVGFGFVMLLGALVAWSLPRVQYGKDNKNERLEYLTRGPPPRPSPAQYTEHDLQGGQQQEQHGVTLQDEHQTRQPWMVGGHRQRRDQNSNRPESNGERPEPSDEDSQPPQLPPGNSLPYPVRTPQARARRKPVQVRVRRPLSEEFDMEEYDCPESARSRFNSRPDSQSQS